MRLGRDGDDGVAADDRGRDPGDEPEQRGLAGATMATTPVGSGTVKLKYGPETGFAPPSTCGSLSAQPAYQTIRSIAPLDLLAAGAGRGEVGAPRLHHLGEAVQHLAAVVGGRAAQPGNAPRAALTASRASLREARAMFCPSASYVRPDSERGNAPPM